MEGTRDRNRKKDLAFWGLIAFLAAVSLAPLWSVRIPPMQDIWQHLALVDIIHYYDAPGSVYPDYFLLPTTPKPNLAYYYVTHWLAYGFGLETANKLVLSLYVLAFPLSFLYLMRSFGRSRWLTLFSFPLIYNAMFAYGFVAFLLGMPILMAGVGVFRRFMATQQEEPFGFYGYLSATALLAAFFTHAHIFLLLGLLCGILWILHRPTTVWGTTLKTWPFIPSLVFFLPWFVRHFVSRSPSSTGITFGSLEQFFGPTYYRPGYVINHFFHFISDYFRNDVDDVLFLLMILVMIILLMGRRAPAIPGDSHRKLAFFDLEILTLTLGVSVMLLPEHIEAQSIVSLRHLVLGLLFFFGWVGFDGVPRRIAVVAVALLTVVQLTSVANLVAGFKKVEAELDGYPSLFQHADGGKRLLQVARNQDSAITAYGAFRHIHFFYMLERGGISDVPFAEYPHNPIQYRRGMVPPKPPVQFTLNEGWFYFDYVLLRKSSMPNIRAAEAHLDPVADVADWSLYRISAAPLPKPVDTLPVASRRRKQVDSGGVVRRTEPRMGGVNVPAVIKHMGRVVPALRGVLRGRGRGTDDRPVPNPGQFGRPVRGRSHRDR